MDGTLLKPHLFLIFSIVQEIFLARFFYLAKKNILEDKDILDAPEKKSATINLPFILPGFIFSVIINFFCWCIYVEIVSLLSTPKYSQFSFFNIRIAHLLKAIIPFILCNVSIYFYLSAIRYKKLKTSHLFGIGFAVLFLGLFGFLIFIEKGNWEKIMYKPHILSYPALSLLFIEVFILLAWIFIKKAKKKTPSILILLLIFLWSLAST